MNTIFTLVFCGAISIMLLPCMASDSKCKVERPSRCNVLFPNTVEYVTVNAVCPSGRNPVLHFGNTYNFEITFKPDTDASKPLLSVIVNGPLGLTVPVTADMDVCKSLQCPLQKGQEYTLTTTLNLPQFPLLFQVNANLNFVMVNSPISVQSLKDLFALQVFCFNLDVVMKPMLATAQKHEKLVFNKV